MSFLDCGNGGAMSSCVFGESNFPRWSECPSSTSMLNVLVFCSHCWWHQVSRSVLGVLHLFTFQRLMNVITRTSPRRSDQRRYGQNAVPKFRCSNVLTEETPPTIGCRAIQDLSHPKIVRRLSHSSLVQQARETYLSHCVGSDRTSISRVSGLS